MSNLVSKIQLSRIAGVKPPRVTYLTKPGKKLHDALVGKRVDLDHKSVRDWLRERHIDLSTVYSDPAPSPVHPTATGQNQGLEVSSGNGELADHPEQVLDMTLRDVIQTFGTKYQFKEWTQAVKNIADIQDKNHKIQRERGDLIERDYVRTHVFSIIDAAFRRLLGDSSKTIARRLYAMAKAGEPIEEAEKQVRDLVSSQIKPIKQKAIKTIKDSSDASK